MPYVPARIIQNNGTALPFRPVLNVIPPAVAADDPVNGATTVTAAGGGATTPVVMSADLTIATQTQMLFRIPITVGSFRVIGTAGSYLVGV